MLVLFCVMSAIVRFHSSARVNYLPAGHKANKVFHPINLLANMVGTGCY